VQAKCDHYIQPTNGESEVIKIQSLNHAVGVTVCECMRANRRKKGEKERRSLITMDLARNLRPPIPWGGSHHCHDAYEVHAATLWGIHTCVTFVRTDCKTGGGQPSYSPIRRLGAQNSLASRVSASHWRRSTCDLPFTAEQAGDRRFAPCTPFCRRQLQHALSGLWVRRQRRHRRWCLRLATGARVHQMYARSRSPDVR
jgi:hypothetical protein